MAQQTMQPQSACARLLHRAMAWAGQHLPAHAELLLACPSFETGDQHRFTDAPTTLSRRDFQARGLRSSPLMLLAEHVCGPWLSM